MSVLTAQVIANSGISRYFKILNFPPLKLKLATTESLTKLYFLQFYFLNYQMKKIDVYTTRIRNKEWHLWYMNFNVCNIYFFVGWFCAVRFFSYVCFKALYIYGNGPNIKFFTLLSPMGSLLFLGVNISCVVLFTEVLVTLAAPGWAWGFTVAKCTCNCILMHQHT